MTRVTYAGPEALELQLEKAAAGGRMLGRHQGQVVLVSGGIPGERVHVRVERVARGVTYAETVEVLSPSPDRRPSAADWRCGGGVYAHIEYPRQVQIKASVLRDAFARIGRLPLQVDPEVIGSPERGYRMRARLHAAGTRLGFFREGSHELCAVAETGQLADATCAWVAAAEGLLASHGLDGVAALEIAENMPGDERACHLELHAGADVAPFAVLADAGPLTGLSAARADRRRVERLSGQPAVTDMVHPRDGDSSSALRLRRDVRAFFQGNRYLLEPLVREVVSLVPDAPVLDLYAGVGLFGLSLAAAGHERVTLVEGDAVSGADLVANAEPFGARVEVVRASVETFLASQWRDTSTVIVDPPRTGLSRSALAALVAGRSRRLVYVSCDVATLARDARALVDAGYALASLTGIDLFPNTAHVESVACFDRT